MGIARTKAIVGRAPHGDLMPHLLNIHSWRRCATLCVGALFERLAHTSACTSFREMDGRRWLCLVSVGPARDNRCTLQLFGSDVMAYGRSRCCVNTTRSRLNVVLRAQHPRSILGRRGNVYVCRVVSPINSLALRKEACTRALFCRLPEFRQSFLMKKLMPRVVRSRCSDTN